MEHKVEVEHTRFAVDVGAAVWYCAAVQAVTWLHARSLVLVGAVAWNSVPVAHAVMAEHARSLAAVLGAETYWAPVQTVSAAHDLSLVVVGATDS